MHNLRGTSIVCASGTNDNNNNNNNNSSSTIAETTTITTTKTMRRRSQRSLIGSSSSSICAILLSVVLLQLSLLANTVNSWMPDVRPDLPLKQDKIIAKFFGNTTDYFKILDHNDATILVGAKDVIYNISLNGLSEISRLEWHSTDADRELCALKGKRETDCHNYLRVFAHLPEDGKILVCGTNSYKPRCRHYTPATNDDEMEVEAATSTKSHYESVYDVEAQGLCPYSPAHNSTYVFADGQLYSATVADFSGSDPLIYRENLRTEQYDLKQLNQPDFVGAVERNGYVLFFFREVSMEYMNFGKAIYSRVGRVCKNDRGGPYTLSKSWTSFLKARLNCSMPGEFPFYFDEIQAISPVVESGDTALIYAVFTTSSNAIPGSAVCAFNVDDIMEAFDGRFKSQKDSQSHWLPMQEDLVPEPRPGHCVDDSRMLSSIAVNFVKNHPLMESAVPHVYRRPLMKKTNVNHRLTTIAIDSQIHALNGDSYDVIYTGTDDGKITKFFNVPTPSTSASSSSTVLDNVTTVLISEMQVLPFGVAIRELIVSPKTNTLLVVSDGSLVTVPLHHCSLIVDCLGCMGLQDPNCAWDTHTHECKSLSAAGKHKFGTKSYLQSLNTTKQVAASLCPKAGRTPGGVVRGTLTADGPAEGTLIPTVTIDVNAVHVSPQNEADLALSKKLHYSNVGAVAAAAASGDPGAGSSIAVNAGGDLDVPSAPGGDYLFNSFNDDNKIPFHPVDPDDLMKDPPAKVEQQTVKMANAGYKPTLIVMLGLLVFIVGIVVGIWATRGMCRPPSLQANHRNQFNSATPFGAKHHNSGKDINLLMNPNVYHCSQKKPNLDLEKDRSHECKNSTENLEKELPCKTSTLTKVKRTYI